MRPVTTRFIASVAGSHTMNARARVCVTYQTGLNPSGTFIDIVSGDVAQDGTAQVRATLDLTTTGAFPSPTAIDPALGPYGNEVYVERGIDFDGATEWVGLGYFRVLGVKQSGTTGPIVVTGADRMRGIIDARMLVPVQLSADMTYGDAVVLLVSAVYPDVVIEWDDSTLDDEIGRSVLVETDRYGGIDDLVASVGKIFYFDYRGVLVIKEIPPTDVPVYSVNAGAGGVLLDYDRELTREGVYNAVVATGEAPDEGDPARGMAINDDPTSPTYFYGKFGQVPRYYSSSLLLTNDACDKAAATILAKATGLPYSADFTAVPNPALEPYDVVSIWFSNTDAAELHVIESMTIGLLSTDAMPVTTRQQNSVTTDD